MNSVLIYRNMAKLPIFTLYITFGSLSSIIGLNFTEFDSPTGAFLVKTHNTFISYNNWKLLYYYELYDIHENFENYKTCIGKMEFICQKIPEKSQC